MTRASAVQSAVAAHSKTALIVTVCLAQFMVTRDATVTNVALPAIARDLQFGTSDLQWVVTAYTLTLGGFLLLGGRSADLFGRRLLFTLGVTIFTVASLANALADSSAALIISRALQGGTRSALPVKVAPQPASGR